MTKKVLTGDDREKLFNLTQKLTVDVDSFCLETNDAFDIRDAALHSLIALDWVAYNKDDNRGEILETPRCSGHSINKISLRSFLC